MRGLVLVAALAGQGAMADTVVATRTIRAQSIITAADIRLDPASVPGAHEDVAAVLGQEARIAIYPGRAVMRGHVGTPALVDRNQVVELIYSQGGLRIVTEGKALGRGAEGDRIRVMNTSSRSVLFGRIHADGSVRVAQ
ncbi:flagellar basal body P-ring formation chaperone FlgA [Pseudoponticoccus marisrubri]|uniref:Flagella basal body P-ring formation protein FlgA n=1 Tax=Pseudoponticoccus marisrubri TaxID=1685382 RepID=A0A0W7WG78_9RHOB|nr:flagellar basal body P-ring formation chaperone FlgA [Pseudoponticoccus marisrubri]KUF09601.1 flagellar biosynthesis protein FlgA [Pseudoponticoccus marisrubri]